MPAPEGGGERAPPGSLLMALANRRKPALSFHPPCVSTVQMWFEPVRHATTNVCPPKDVLNVLVRVLTSYDVTTVTLNPA